MPDYVVCSSCGARIKATRERCLRCLEPLHGDETPAWPSLKLSRGQTLMLATVASLVVLVLIAVLWQTRPQQLDTLARPYAAPGVAPNPAATAPAVEPTTDTPAPSADVAAVTEIRRSANVALSTGNLESARAAYEAALEKKADDPEALNGLGLVLERSGKLDEAIARYAQAVQLVPDKWTYRFNLAHAEGQAQLWDRAVADYREAARLFPEDYATQYNLALALHTQGDDRAAIPEYEKAIQLAPGEPSFHLSLAMSLERVGKTADAAREYQQFLQMEPSAPEAEKIKAHVQSLTSAQPGAAQKPSLP